MHLFIFSIEIMYYLHKTTSAVSYIKPNASQWEAMLRDDVGFATVYRKIYRRKFLTLSNQTSRYIRECIRINIWIFVWLFYNKLQVTAYWWVSIEHLYVASDMNYGPWYSLKNWFSHLTIIFVSGSFPVAGYLDLQTDALLTVLWSPAPNILANCIELDKVLFFNQKVSIFFLFLDWNKCCGYSLEVPQRGTSNEYPQHMFSSSSRNKKNIYLIPTLI